MRGTRRTPPSLLRRGPRQQLVYSFSLRFVAILASSYVCVCVRLHLTCVIVVQPGYNWVAVYWEDPAHPLHGVYLMAQRPALCITEPEL